MKHKVKIVVGANYGDEGKGLMSRYFTKEFSEAGHRSVTVLHNGSAQRGHTVDYADGTRHVFHNFGTGARDGGVTYYADTFLVHPMDFCREVAELGFAPKVFCNPACVVVTPFDMLADHVIEDYIEVKSGVREYGSCGYGTWSATERILKRPEIAYTVSDFARGGYFLKMHELWQWAADRVKEYGVDLDVIPTWKKYFDYNSGIFSATCRRFQQDWSTFLNSTKPKDFSGVWDTFDSMIFEGAQGLLLDKSMGSEWVTTSNTGVKNPAKMLGDYNDYEAEVCYVTRSYLTRHGEGPLDGETDSNKVGEIGEDKTNLANPFQGKLRYAPLDTSVLEKTIAADFSFADSVRYHRTLAITHCNEVDLSGGDYRSYNPVIVSKF